MKVLGEGHPAAAQTSSIDDPVRKAWEEVTALVEWARNRRGDVKPRAS